MTLANVLQLRDVKVRRMAEYLEASNSAYFQAFKVIFQDVVAGNVEKAKQKSKT